MKSYNDLIADLSDKLNMEIYPDLNNVVTMKIDRLIKIQIETDVAEEFLILGAFIAELPPGKFREHILKDALKANYLVNKKPEILAYLGRENSLTLHRKFILGSITVEDLVDYIKSMVDRAKKWHGAIESGKASPDEELPSKTDGSNRSMFGF